MCLLYKINVTLYWILYSEIQFYFMYSLLLSMSKSLIQRLHSFCKHSSLFLCLKLFVSLISISNLWSHPQIPGFACFLFFFALSMFSWVEELYHKMLKVRFRKLVSSSLILPDRSMSFSVKFIRLIS